MKQRTILYADEGNVLTDGIDVYATPVMLEIGRDENDFYEITEEEHKEILKQEQEKLRELGLLPTVEEGIEAEEESDVEEEIIIEETIEEVEQNDNSEG